jgi:hypothetical protein
MKGIMCSKGPNASPSRIMLASMSRVEAMNSMMDGKSHFKIRVMSLENTAGWPDSLWLCLLRTLLKDSPQSAI